MLKGRRAQEDAGAQTQHMHVHVQAHARAHTHAHTRNARTHACARAHTQPHHTHAHTHTDAAHEHTPAANALGHPQAWQNRFTMVSNTVATAAKQTPHFGSSCRVAALRCTATIPLQHFIIADARLQQYRPCLAVLHPCAPTFPRSCTHLHVPHALEQPTMRRTDQQLHLSRLHIAQLVQRR